MIRTLVVTRSGRDPDAEAARAAFAAEGHAGVGVRFESVFRLEGDCDLERIGRLLANPAAGEAVAEDGGIEGGDGECVVEVAYRPAVVDPETESALEAARLMGVPGLEWLRAGRRYVVTGVDRAEAERVITKHLFNDVVQVIVGPGDYQQSLRPTGTPEPVRTHDLTGLSDSELSELSQRMGWYAPLSQLQALRAHQAERGRPWTDVEIEMVVQSWGDHCYHTTWKGLGLLKGLMAATREINHPLCVSIFTDNAGAIRFYGGQAIFIKGETHNHPSAISTKGGVETKHGGVLRDIIFMGRGGYPIGSSTIMGTRRPSEPEAEVPAGALHPRTIVLESISGTASYCNPMGVPMMYAVYRAHPGYAKCMALGQCVGIAPEETIAKLEPQPGDVLMLIGGATGRDGVHGAVASSAQLTAEMVEKEGATVQIGHPIVERKFTNLVPVLRDKGWIRTCTDLGAGGISCCVGEIAAQCGADVELDGLPLKDASLASWEKWVSESQERGLLVIQADHLDDVRAECKRYAVDYYVLGTCRDDGRLVVTDGGATVADLDLRFLWEACPIDPLTTADPHVTRAPVAPSGCGGFSKDLAARVLGDFACCDQSWAVHQFDSTVQGRTVVGPMTGCVPSDVYVSAPVRGKPYGMVSSCAFVPRWSEVDPVGSVGSLMALAISRSVAVGASLDDIALCGNYYTPSRNPEQLWYLEQMVLQGAARLSKLFGTPFISGKDSSSGTFRSSDGQAIDVPHTFVPSTLCRMPDVRKVTVKPFRRTGDAIVAVWPRCTPSLAGSVALELLRGSPGGPARLAWPEDEDDLVGLWRRLAQSRGLLSSAAAIGEGGAFLQIVHGCLSSGLGAEVDVDADEALWLLLGEPAGGFLLTTSKPEELEAALEGFEVHRLGQVTYGPGLCVSIGGQTAIHRDDWPELMGAWSTAFEKEVLR